MKNSAAKDIVIINQDSGYLMIDIANMLVRHDRKCTIVAGRMVKRKAAIGPGVSLRKIIRYRRSNPFARLLTWSIGSVQILWLIWFSFRKKYLIVFSNPPFAPLLTRLVSNRYSLFIFDIYPEAIVNYGFLSADSFPVRKWKQLNRKVYSGAERIFTLTGAMRNSLAGYCDPSKIEVIPLWTDQFMTEPVLDSENLFIHNHGLQGKFVVLYSGRLGTTNDAEVLIDVARQTKRKDVVILIVGHGDKSRQIRKKVHSLELSNCIVLPWQPPELFPYVLSSADLAVVSLGKSAAGLAIPSKVMDYFSVGLPVLGLAPRDSELEKLIEKTKSGRCFEPEMIDEISEFIFLLASDKKLRAKFEKNSRAASQLYTVSNSEKLLV